MGSITKPFTFASGNTIVASEVNSNEDTLYNEINGNLTDINIHSGANIASSKIDLSSINQSVNFTSPTTYDSTSSWGKGADVASIASMTLGNDGNLFDITGTTSITSITIKPAGTIIILHFDDILTLTDGSNLLLSGNLVTTTGDTITLISDGTNWIEIARSVN